MKNQNLKTVRRVGTGLAFILYPLFSGLAFAAHPNLLSLEVSREAGDKVGAAGGAELAGDRCFDVAAREGRGSACFDHVVPGGDQCSCMALHEWPRGDVQVSQHFIAAQMTNQPDGVQVDVGQQECYGSAGPQGTCRDVGRVEANVGTNLGDS